MRDRIKTSWLHDKIIRMTGMYGYITVEEVAIITDNNRKAYNVLQYLSTKGTLGTFSTHLNPSKAYYLPEDIRTVLESTGHFVVKFYPYMFRGTTFYHHITTMKLHLIIEKIFKDRLLEYYPEKVLKMQDNPTKVFDGIMKIINTKGNTRTIAIEVELTLKNAEKRRAMARRLKEFISSNEIDGVIIFYNNILIKERLNEAFNTEGLTGILYTNLQSFINDPWNTKLEIWNKETKTFDNTTTIAGR